MEKRVRNLEPKILPREPAEKIFRSTLEYFQSILNISEVSQKIEATIDCFQSKQLRRRIEDSEDQLHQRTKASENQLLQRIEASENQLHRRILILDAPSIIDNYYLNLMDWGNCNILAIALRNTIYLWYAADGSTSKLCTIGDEDGPITSVSWAPTGRNIAIGLDNSHVQLWDSVTNKLVSTMDWNNHIITTGGIEGLIFNNDVRVGSHMWLYRLEDHTAAVKALAWCPFQSHLLASAQCSAFRINVGNCTFYSNDLSSLKGLLEVTI
ncbi:hypothetical protein UlMin_019561 [Ulmus minor]